MALVDEAAAALGSIDRALVAQGFLDDQPATEASYARALETFRVIKATGGLMMQEARAAT